MGVTKSSIFSEQENDFANIAKAIGHPARIAILKALLQQNECVCGDLVVQLDLAQSTISQHLKELKRVGLIKGSVEGTKVCYCINRENWTYYQKQFADLFGMISLSDCENENCC